MGLGGISIWQLLIILAIVVLIFGTKRLKSIGGDLGGAIKSFRKAVNDGESEEDKARLDQEKTANQADTAANGESKATKTDSQQP